MEDKYLICDCLTRAIQATRAGRHIASLQYDESHDIVLVYEDGDLERPVRTINVACDSGIAMIRDIMRYIDIG